MTNSRILSLIILCGSYLTYAGFTPYYPGYGNLAPSYSYQQPSYYGGGYQQPGYGGYQQPGYGGYQQSPYGGGGYPQRFGASPLQRLSQGQWSGGGSGGSIFDCSANSCGTLKGFKKCLGSQKSAYRYFIFHPEALESRQARTRLRTFINDHPKCYTQFCNRVCSTVPEQFLGAARKRPQKANWLRRQADWARQNKAWRTREAHTRFRTRIRIEDLCKRQDNRGKEIRLWCSECADYLKGDREMIDACRAEITYNISPVIRFRKRGQQGQVQHVVAQEEITIGGGDAPQMQGQRQQKTQIKTVEQRQQQGTVVEKEAGPGGVVMSSTSSQRSESSQGSEQSSDRWDDDESSDDDSGEEFSSASSD
ncbi:MAG: hypothetical protein A2621_01355 [Alphaproteobacteria bacterium RIFCSPHIGHO2_01_FULL_41_14]|nr:MAG: hypothetical protein A2065_01000 [Alphaproteobacteria bacterium GWB1_45_5]OFW89550.1 MAG: hypothetical protein A2621_01355 [Alphaproteobacteria bacterium RIFCSPHIGHO2_01_FULL_41_14]HCI48879.1 hypothetical protein [Holosporales bacterium]